MWTFGRGSAADDADAVGAGVDDTATVGPGLADNEAASDGLGLSDGPAVHALRTSAMAITSRPKRRLMPDTVEARLGAGLGDGPEDRDGRPVRSTGLTRPNPPTEATRARPEQVGLFQHWGHRVPVFARP